MQQKMMLFTPAVGVIYGLWFFLVPNSYWSVMTVPADLISELASAQLQNTGLALLVIAYVLIATRKYISSENISEFMTIHAIGWAIFAIGGLYLVFSSGDPIGNNPFFYQALIFLVIAAGFYAKRN
tara:strand:+ start:139 stop:516 length:378 start_codon:yes stop_codon:yes gene_type:complete